MNMSHFSESSINFTASHKVLESILTQDLDPMDQKISNLYHCINKSSELSQQKCDILLKGLFIAPLPPSRIPIIVIYMILFIEGVFGNSLVILCVILFRRMRSATNVFLLNLALSDLLVFLLCKPSVLTTMLYNKWIYGKVVCKFLACFQGTTIGVSIFTLTGISVERYRMISRPMHTASGLRCRYLALWIVLIWLVAFVICLPLLFAYEVHQNDPYPGSAFKTDHCIETWRGSWRSRQIFTVVLFVSFYLLPFIFMTVLYFLMSRKLLNQSTLLQSNPPNNRGATSSSKYNSNAHSVCLQRRRISLLLSVLLSLFAACWIPYHGINLFVDFYYTGEARQQLVGWVVVYAYPAAQFFTFANSAVNPLCTLFCSEKFRKAIKQLGRGECVNQREHSRRELHSRHFYNSSRRTNNNNNSQMMEMSFRQKKLSSQNDILEEHNNN